ncbi:hypothetical protein BV22DRAFT_1108445 [Leucogyrophana mollusca]|uniref:Uncharacterized protein n=1 Tax=Leucogyrophana mollusca TaxID=85980 RepID=A0ACB8AXZ1_9AGAM|nr:hypothetical protein BV22DRAFT_1108445 [Leucogyrophana mollusca]
MVYQKISTDMKEQALKLLGDGWEMDEIADALGISEKSIGRWEDKMLQEGRVDTPSILHGRRRLLNATAIAELQELIKESPSLFLDEISEWLAIYHDQPISTAALHNNLHDLGLTYKVLKHTAAQRDEDQHAAWWLDMATNFLADQSLSLNGYIALRVVCGSVDDGEFYDFIINDVLPQMNPYPQPQSVLIMDNCSIHKSDALQVAVEAAGREIDVHFQVQY